MQHLVSKSREEDVADEEVPTEDSLTVSLDITRRDFIHDVSLSSLGMLAPLGGWAQLGAEDYPPVLTGMRGSPCAKAISNQSSKRSMKYHWTKNREIRSSRSTRPGPMCWPGWAPQNDRNT